MAEKSAAKVVRLTALPSQNNHPAGNPGPPKRWIDPGELSKETRASESLASVTALSWIELVSTLVTVSKRKPIVPPESIVLNRPLISRPKALPTLPGRHKPIQGKYPSFAAFVVVV